MYTKFHSICPLNLKWFPPIQEFSPGATVAWFVEWWTSDRKVAGSILDAS